MQFKILNTREIKKLIKQIEEEYKAASLKLDYIFLKNNENKIFIISEDLKNLDATKLHINNLGLYLAKIETDGVRLSVEGSQLVGNNSQKILDLDRKEIDEWIRGEDVKKETDKKGYFIVRHGEDFYGTAKIKNNALKNFVPKYRRIKK